MKIRHIKTFDLLLAKLTNNSYKLPKIDWVLQSELYTMFYNHVDNSVFDEIYDMIPINLNPKKYEN